MAFRTKIVPTVVTRLRCFIRFDHRFMHPLQNLMQLVEVINIILELRFRVTGSSLNINLNDEPRLIIGVDLALTTITCVVDHLLSARVEGVPQRDQ